MSAPMKICFRKLIFSEIRQIYSLSTGHTCSVSNKYIHSTRNYHSCKHVTEFHGRVDIFEKLLKHSIWNQRRKYSLQTRNCWKCGKLTNTVDEMFICKCGVVQSVQDVSYFDIMGVEDSFDVDTAALSKNYKELQKVLHPDKNTLKSEQEKQLFEQQSSLVNKAYATLIKPLNRALYMLERHGHPIEEDNKSVDQEFLVEILEINEEIAEADSLEALEPIDLVNRKRLDDNIRSLSNAFQKGDLTHAKQLVVNLKYFTNIDDKIKEIHRQQF